MSRSFCGKVQRQHVPEQIGLGLLADFVADAVPADVLIGVGANAVEKVSMSKGRKYLTEREVEQLMTQTCYSTGH